MANIESATEIRPFQVDVQIRAVFRPLRAGGG
jgi:hypothetical protein